ncbi:MAG: PAS domain S-box protein [Clostridia bacterium]|nr:PAS domain S-box protein [Clostridia bacterium]
MKSAVFRAICITCAVLILLTAGGMLFAVHGQTEETRIKELESKTHYLLQGYHLGGIPYLESVQNAGKERITLISPLGMVLYDSEADAQSMDSHADRPEFLQALEAGKGKVIRPSSTMGKKTYYIALRAEDGNVLRLSVNEQALIQMIDNSASVIAAILVLLVALAALVAKQLTATVISPINKLNLDRPLENDTYEEFTPLLMRLEHQNKEIETQFAQLQAKSQELELITENMGEAFAVFSAEGKVLLANHAAERLFGCYDLTDRPIDSFCKEEQLLNVMKRVFAREAVTENYQKDGKVYHISAYPVSTGGEYAAVLVAEDVTHRENAEQMRREFTANVSHELKTPLTTIMGSSEIIAEGIARPEDHATICRGIHTEAARLLTLIEDIIKLSRLDEGQIRAQFEAVELKALAESVLSRLTQKAARHQISLHAEGEAVFVSGVSATLHEMLFNLCDNAIIYNRPNGWVEVRVEKRADKAVLAVRDNGIGIEKSDHPRIFERFYRVDKSRSKAVGGTGLGLSIVKHAVLLHKGEIILESTPGEGTTITVLLPLLTLDQDPKTEENH